MAHKLTAKARVRLGCLAEAQVKWQHVHSLVARLVSGKEEVHPLKRQIARASQKVGQILSESGVTFLAEGANELAKLARGGGSIERKFRRIRELVGTVSAGMERAEGTIKKGG